MNPSPTSRQLALALISFSIAFAAAWFVDTAFGHFPPQGRECPRITFVPNTDFAAYEIHAYRTSCRTARAVARHRGPQQKRDRFSCQTRVQHHGDRFDGIGHTDFRCTRGKAVVTFVIS